MYSTTDLNQAYLPIPLAKNSREIVALGIPGKGLDRFARGSYGLTGAPTSQKFRLRIRTDSLRASSLSEPYRRGDTGDREGGQRRRDLQSLHARVGENLEEAHLKQASPY